MDFTPSGVGNINNGLLVNCISQFYIVNYLSRPRLHRG